LLLPGNIKAIEGATHENVNRDDVQESAGAQDPATGFRLQAVRGAHILAEFFESPSRGPREERPLTVPVNVRSIAMQFSLIPWQEFLDALKKQNPSTRETWLRRWVFTDEGVITATPEKHSTPSRSPSAAVAAAR
jgi:hypothetical protein